MDGCFLAFLLILFSLSAGAKEGIGVYEEAQTAMEQYLRISSDKEVDQLDLTLAVSQFYIDLDPEDFNRLTAYFLDRYYQDPKSRDAIVILFSIVDTHFKEEFAERELENIFWSTGEGALNGFFLVIVANMLHRLSKVGVTKTFFDRLKRLSSIRIGRGKRSSSKGMISATELVLWKKNRLQSAKLWIDNNKHKRGWQYLVGVSAGAGLGAGWYHWNHNLTEVRLSPSKALKNIYHLILAEAAYTNCVLHHKKEELASDNAPFYLELAKTHLKNVEDITALNFQHHFSWQRWIDIPELPEEFRLDEENCRFPEGTKVLPELIHRQLLEFRMVLENMID